MYIYSEQLKAWVVDYDGDGTLDAIKPSENRDPLTFFGQPAVEAHGGRQLDLSALDPETVRQYFSQACGPLQGVSICPFLDYIHFVEMANYLGDGCQQSDYLCRAYFAARQANLPECLLVEGVQAFVELEKRDPEFSLTVDIHLCLENDGEVLSSRSITRRQRKREINETLFEQTTRMCDLIANDRNGLVDWPSVPAGETFLETAAYGLSVGPFTSAYTGRAEGPYVLSADVVAELQQYALFVHRSKAPTEIKAFALEQVGRALAKFVHEQIRAAREMKAREQLPLQTMFWQDMTSQLIRLPAPLLQSVVNVYSTSYDEGLILALYCGEYAVL